MRIVARFGRPAVWFVLLVLSMMALLMGAPGAVAEHVPEREIRGVISFPTPYGDAIDPGDGPARCAWLSFGERSQGIVGHVVAIRPEEGNHITAYGLSTSTPMARIRIVFHFDLGTCADGGNPGSSAEAAPGAPVTDLIPFGATHAVVYVPSGSQVLWCHTLPCPPRGGLSSHPVDFALRIGG